MATEVATGLALGDGLAVPALDAELPLVDVVEELVKLVKLVVVELDVPEVPLTDPHMAVLLPHELVVLEPLLSTVVRALGLPNVTPVLSAQLARVATPNVERTAPAARTCR